MKSLAPFSFLALVLVACGGGPSEPTSPDSGLDSGGNDDSFGPDTSGGGDIEDDGVELEPEPEFP